jgi:hypothetical protein
MRITYGDLLRARAAISDLVNEPLCASTSLRLRGLTKEIVSHLRTLEEERSRLEMSTETAEVKESAWKEMLNTWVSLPDDKLKPSDLEGARLSMLAVNALEQFIEQ